MCSNHLTTYSATNNKSSTEKKFPFWSNFFEAEPISAWCWIVFVLNYGITSEVCYYWKSSKCLLSLNRQLIRRNGAETTVLMHQWKTLLDETFYARIVQTECYSCKIFRKSGAFFANFLQDPNISCKIFEKFVNDDAFSYKILQKFFQ